MNEKPTHLDLFSGIGGFAIAAARCGFRTIGFSEIDSYASAVLKKHWPSVRNYGDIRNVTGWGGHVDLITAGFPCQPFSLAGSRRGISDERHLWPVLRRAVGEVRPKWCLFENVPGLMSNDAGRVFGGVLRDLAALRYDVVWNCVPASAVGADHERDRLWIVANLSRSGGRQQQKSWAQCQNPSDNHNNGQKGLAADTDRPGLEKLNRLQCGAAYPNARTSSLQNFRNTGAVEPCLGRGLHGIPNRTNRIKCLGNSIVPQVAEIFLKEIRKLISGN